MADGSSFSFDARGLVTSVSGAKGSRLDEAVGQPALDVLGLLLAASGKDGSPVLQLDAWRDGEDTVVAAVGSAASPGTARAESAYMSSAFDKSVAGIELYDADLRLLRSNRAARAVRGARAEDLTGRSAADLDAGLRLSPLLAEAMEPARACGDCPVVERDVSKGRRTYSVLALPLREGRAVIGAAAIVHDVTENVRAREERQLLAAVHARVGTTLGIMRTAQELASALTEDFADAVTVDVVEAVFHGEEGARPPVSSRAPLRRAAFSAAADFTSLYDVGEPSRFLFPTPYTQALSDLRPRLLDPHGSPADWHMHDSARADVLRRSGVHSMILAPVVQQGRVLGLVCLYRGRRDPAPFDRRDLALAEQVTARAAVHMDNARRYTRELTTAATLQRRLLPHHIPQLPALRTAYFWKPGGRTTHWFDVIALSGARVGLAMGQIPQHGLQASVDMGRFRTAFATLARMDLPPDELLAHLDDITHEMQQEDEAADGRPQPEGESTRCLYAIYDTITGQCAVACADWPAPLVTTPDGDTRPLDLPVGPPLGQTSGYERTCTTLAPRALLTLYSASMLRPAHGDDAFALLRRAAGTAAGDPQAACDNIVYALMDDHARGHGGGAVLTAVVRRLPEGDHVSWTAPRDEAAVARCRARARRQLAQWGLDDHVFATEVVISELVTNVLRHAGGEPHVRMIRNDRLTVEVSDESSTAPHLRHARAQDESGRGLLIAAALADRWGTRYGDRGKTVWVEQDLTAPDDA